MAVQNMHLTCAANNVGAYWGTPMKDYLGEFFTLKKTKMLWFIFYGNDSKLICLIMNKILIFADLKY